MADSEDQGKILKTRCGPPTPKDVKASAKDDNVVCIFLLFKNPFVHNFVLLCATNIVSLILWLLSSLILSLHSKFISRCNRNRHLQRKVKRSPGKSPKVTVMMRIPQWKKVWDNIHLVYVTQSFPERRKLPDMSLHQQTSQFLQSLPDQLMCKQSQKVWTMRDPCQILPSPWYPRKPRILRLRQQQRNTQWVNTAHIFGTITHSLQWHEKISIWKYHL